MGCQSRAYYNSGANCSKELIKQITEQLATQAVRDTDFANADSLTGEEYIAIVQDGKNKRIKISELLSVGASARIGTTEYWNNKIGFIPTDGEIIIYSDYDSIVVDERTVNVPGIKIGSGNAFVQDLTFVGAADREDLLAHINNTTVHVTNEDKLFWNNKLNVTDNQEVIGEALVFNRN